MNPTELKTFIEGVFQQMQMICDFMVYIGDDTLRGILNKTKRDNTIYGLYLRAVCLLKTLRKCNQASDFQSIVHANRALIELAVDLTLLYRDKTEESLQKLLAWEESAKLKGSEAALRLYEERGLDLPKQYMVRKKFVEENRESVRQQRTRYWSKPNEHPNRWTGNGLDRDIEFVDRAYDVGLYQLYRTEYTWMNWMIHGSALTGLRHLDSLNFMNLCGLTYVSCGKLGMMCTEVVLREFGYFELEDFRSRWDELNKRLVLHMTKFIDLDKSIVATT